jgi:hypothetical protein
MFTRSIRLTLLGLALGSDVGLAQVVGAPQIDHLALIVPRDSGGSVMTPLSSLDLPSQRPWQNQFHVILALASSDSARVTSLEVLVSFDLRMGPQLYGGPDGEVLLTRRIDSLGVWFRSPTIGAQSESCASGCPKEIRLGPFELDHLIPGPKGPDALLWPTRLRVTAQVLAVPLGHQLPPSGPSLRRSIAIKEVPIR